MAAASRWDGSVRKTSAIQQAAYLGIHPLSMAFLLACRDQQCGKPTITGKIPHFYEIYE